MKTSSKNFFAPLQIGGLLAVAFGLLSTTNTARAGALALTVTGFDSTGIATPANTTMGANGSLGGFSFYDANFAAQEGFSSAGVAGAFPNGDGGVITGASGNAYAIAPASGSDDLVDNGTLTFAPGTSGYSTLYVLGGAFNGSATVDYTLSFVDSATTVTGTLFFHDWGKYTGDISGLGRQQGGNFDGNGDIFGLSDPSISLPVADQSFTLDSLDITSPGNSFLFAVSGVSNIPEPSSWAMMLVGAGALVLVAGRRFVRAVI